MNRIITAIFVFVAAIGPAVAQVENQSGLSQPSVTGGEYGQTRDGVQWQSRDVNGTQFYSDTTGKNCWSQPSVTGGRFTSCN